MAKKPKEAPTTEIPMLVDQAIKMVAKGSQPDDLQLEMMFKQYKRGKLIKEIAEEYSITPRMVSYYKDKYKWDERKTSELAVIDSPAGQVAVEAYVKILKSVHRLSDEIYRSIVLEEGPADPMHKANLKVITEIVDKLTRLHIFAEAGGVTKSEHTNKVVKVDYAKMAEIYMQAKKDGIKYDDKAHLKDVIDATYKDVSKK